MEDREQGMQEKTGEGLAEFAKKRLGTPYFYGAKITHGVLTEAFMEEMHRKFPRLADDAYLEKARRQGQIGRVNVDCSGLIGAYRGKERSTAQLYAWAYRRLPIEHVREFAVGTVLWKPGHVGIYAGICGGIPCCVEAKGIDHGTILSKTADTDWRAGLTFPDLVYTYGRKISGTHRGKNPYEKPCGPVMQAEAAVWRGVEGAVTGGEGVRWLQWELTEAGYETEADGIFGRETYKNLTAYQTSCEIWPDGIAGEVTKKMLDEK